MDGAKHQPCSCTNEFPRRVRVIPRADLIPNRAPFLLNTNTDKMKDEDTITAVGAAFAILSVLAVIIRFYVQFALKSGAKWDDWLILASLLLMLGIDVLSIYGSCPLHVNEGMTMIYHSTYGHMLWKINY